jgi:hypothetical protein
MLQLLTEEGGGVAHIQHSSSGRQKRATKVLACAEGQLLTEADHH